MNSDRISRYLVLKGYFLFLLIIPVLTVPGFISAQTIEITLDLVRELSEQHSPQWQQFENRLKYDISGERSAAARLNPSIAYDLDFWMTAGRLITNMIFICKKSSERRGIFVAFAISGTAEFCYMRSRQDRTGPNGLPVQGSGLSK